jgi:putative DNA primase/helicase
VTDARDGEPINLHRTWLAKDGSGKAPIDKPRRLLKGHRSNNGVIRLWPDDDVTLGR